MCGDPASGEGAGYHEGGGKYEQTVGIRVTHYHAGDIIAVKGTMTANHLGYFRYYLCVLPAGSKGGTGERSFLTDACFERMPLRVQQDGTWGDRFYVADKLADFSNAVQLPNIECPRCVLRWYYISGNSCTPPGTPAKWADPDLSVCGSGQWVPSPEQFWNCADVALLKKGAPLPSGSRTVIKGDLSTGASTPTNDTGGGGGGNQKIDRQTDPEGDGSTGDGAGAGAGDGAGGGTGAGTDTGSWSLSVEQVAIGAVAAAVIGTPIVFMSPLVGVGAGLFAFLMVLLALAFINKSGTGKDAFFSGSGRDQDGDGKDDRAYRQARWRDD